MSLEKDINKLATNILHDGIKGNNLRAFVKTPAVKKIFKELDINTFELCYLTDHSENGAEESFTKVLTKALEVEEIEVNEEIESALHAIQLLINNQVDEMVNSINNGTGPTNLSLLYIKKITNDSRLLNKEKEST